MDKILIRGLEINACHGVRSFEKTDPQPFVFDADVYVDFYKASLSDDLRDTVDYSGICSLIQQVTFSNSFNLIEKLAYECAYAVLGAYPAVSRISLTAYKPNAPVKQKFSSVGVSVDVSREIVYLSLGSSLGNRRAYIDKALGKLSLTRGISVKKVSSYIKTAPKGGVAVNEFLNCAAEIETFLSPRALLNRIHEVEAECGRVRVKRWEDRTVDIDIIFFGKREIVEDDLIIPHPAYASRAFVINPLKEIAPEFVCPGSGVKIKDMKI